MQEEMGMPHRRHVLVRDEGCLGQKAYELLGREGFPLTVEWSDVRVPELKVDDKRYVGLDEIRKYVRDPDNPNRIVERRTSVLGRPDAEHF